MHGVAWLEPVLILLLAAGVAVPIFIRSKLGAALAYLFAGALLGPHALAVVATGEGQFAVAELGVVLLMFLVGLELSPARLWLLRRAVFGLGLIQFFATSVAFALIALALGYGWKIALVVGCALSLSSTAIGVQLMAERKVLTLPCGRNVLGILLLQDLAAIPALALIPLLGVAVAGGGFSLVGGLEGIKPTKKHKQQQSQRPDTRRRAPGGCAGHHI